MAVALAALLVPAFGEQEAAVPAVREAPVDPATAKAPESGERAAPLGIAPPRAGGPMRYLPDRFAGRAGRYYRAIWGVSDLSVKWAESGEVIRFSYRVVDADKAKPLADKAVEPQLVDPEAGVSLVVPQMEKIGKLRQTGVAEPGRTYWVAFSNKGRIVKRGAHVTVVIGQFRAEGLVVD